MKTRNPYRRQLRRHPNPVASIQARATSTQSVTAVFGGRTPVPASRATASTDGPSAQSFGSAPTATERERVEEEGSTARLARVVGAEFKVVSRDTAHLSQTAPTESNSTITRGTQQLTSAVASGTHQLQVVAGAITHFLFRSLVMEMSWGVTSSYSVGMTTPTAIKGCRMGRLGIR